MEINLAEIAAANIRLICHIPIEITFANVNNSTTSSAATVMIKTNAVVRRT